MTERPPSEPVRIAFAAHAVEPDGPADDRPAIEGLARRGALVETPRWDDGSVDWSRYDVVLPRSTWDYHRRLDRFLGWVGHVAAVTRFENPPEIVRWNAHKRYLLDLAERGGDVVPTELVPKGAPRTLAAVRRRHGWGAVVIKPEVGADSDGLVVAEAADGGRAETALAGLVGVGDVLVQPFLPEVRERGERSLIFFLGRFSHAARYRAVIDERPRQPVAFTPTSGELGAAERIVRTLSPAPLYARLDYLPVGGERWCLSELELIEPELLFRAEPSAGARFAEALLERIGSRPTSAHRG